MGDYYWGDLYISLNFLNIYIISTIKWEAFMKKQKYKKYKQIDNLYVINLSLIHISEPTRRTPISYAVFCLKKKKKICIKKKNNNRKNDARKLNQNQSFKHKADTNEQAG